MGQKSGHGSGNPDKIFVVTFGGGFWYGPAKGDIQDKEDIATPVLSY